MALCPPSIFACRLHTHPQPEAGLHMQPLTNGDLRMAYEIYQFTWRGIEIEARYNPVHYGETAHLEICSLSPKSEPLPITQTGYRSHFHPRGVIDLHGAENRGDTLIAHVIDWLDAEAEKPTWKKFTEEHQQLNLFNFPE